MILRPFALFSPYGGAAFAAWFGSRLNLFAGVKGAKGGIEKRIQMGPLGEFFGSHFGWADLGSERKKSSSPWIYYYCSRDGLVGKAHS